MTDCWWCRTFLPWGPWQNIWVMQGEGSSHSSKQRCCSSSLFTAVLCDHNIRPITHSWSQWICAAHLLLLLCPREKSTAPENNNASAADLRRREVNYCTAQPSRLLKRCSEWAHVEQSSREVMGNGKFMNFNWLLEWMRSHWTWSQARHRFMIKEAISLTETGQVPIWNPSTMYSCCFLLP